MIAMTGFNKDFPLLVYAYEREDIDDAEYYNLKKKNESQEKEIMDKD